VQVNEVLRFCCCCVGVSASDAVKPYVNILSHKNSWFLSPKCKGYGSGLEIIFGCHSQKLSKMLGTYQYATVALCHVPAAGC
jgi:hypothetical protein